MSSDQKTIVTRWWLVRHAPIVDVEAGRLSGQADVAANVSDAERFASVAAKLPQGAVWLTSHLKRTRQTAEALWAAGAERVEPVIEQAFAEQAFGAWTQMTWEEVGELDDPIAKSFWDAPAATSPPASETYATESAVDVLHRVGRRLEELAQDYSGRDIVCVAHAGSIRSAVAYALGISAEQALALNVENTSLTRLDHVSAGLQLKRGGNWRVVALNRI